MANLTAGKAFYDISFFTLTCHVANLVAFETKLRVTFERIMRILPTENTFIPTAFIWTLSRHVAKLLAISTLDCGVRLSVVSRLLVFQLSILIILALCILLTRLLDRVNCLTVSIARFFFVKVNLLAKVLVAFN